MNDAAEDTLRNLLSIVERDRDERCQRIRREAEQEARALVRQARAEARRRVTEAVREARRRAQTRLDDARAAHTTRARQRRQEASRALLERARDLLPAELEQVWRTDGARRRWIDRVLRLAADTLPLGTWAVGHPPGLPDGDRSHLHRRIEEITGDPPELAEDEDLSAGLRICVGSTCLDGTTRGLLADRRTVEGRLLAEMIREVDRNEGET